ncbi:MULTISPECIES: hypothetical protein [Staphylococcus]|jgi:hypothetical protein|uniref:hypothetical protein n=1 Tax=Staphylococcus TaxID=1279 RepID=UPI000207C659|nr:MULTISPECIES: hypothetical protein [Staphylococcus]EGG72239.1 hypothetical protein SEVCU045_1484 [Staphylococcus epidermidis VCU045]EJD95128.1 hypothetical protein HMPREF9987_04874 [Staphylococcus epidermidis NIHLM049]KAA9231570.1 hypothetical protein F6I41_01570 [Staphylococcus epidermidis]MCG1123782.1 hypothetical protein [Staphylococcus epidermidis]MCG1948040.1 hypothetical protein [Staphylococcus epidermidis]
MEDNKWTTLKDELTQKYIELHGESNNITNNMLTDEIANILVGKRVVKQQLQRMDELDGTNDFNNLLNDLEACNEQ